MERFAIAEARYNDAVRKLNDARTLLEPYADPEFPKDARDRLEQARAELLAIAEDVTRIAWQVGKLSIER